MFVLNSTAISHHQLKREKEGGGGGRTTRRKGRYEVIQTKIIYTPTTLKKGKKNQMHKTICSI